MKHKNPFIFVVEDDPSLNKLLTSYIKSKLKCKVESYLSGEDCIKNLDKNPDIILQDYDLPGMNGFQVMQKTKEIDPKIEFIFLSGQSEIQTAIDILRKGAFDYIVKDSHAKENALVRIKKLLYIKKLEFEKKSYKWTSIIFFGTLLLTWIFFAIMKMTGVFM